MVRKGFTGAGAQRWFCRSCMTTQTRRRLDNTTRSRRQLLASWMAGMKPLAEIAKRIGVSREHLSRRLSLAWRTMPPSPVIVVEDDVLVLDALGYAGGVVCLLRTVERPAAAWHFADTENAEGWYAALGHVRGEPRVMVSDHQKGLRLAAKQRFPEVLHQRCIAHIIRRAQSWITRRPKTSAGKYLRRLVLHLASVRTEDGARAWTALFERWRIHFRVFLSETTEGQNGRRWYTHRYLRKTVSLLRGAVPEMFTFTLSPNTPRTSNHVEGGLNAQLAERLQRHRGLPPERQQALITFFLEDWNERKSCTRNIT